MTRRSFFGMVIGAFAGSAVVAASGPAATPPVDRSFSDEYRYQLGKAMRMWKGDVEREVLIHRGAVMHSSHGLVATNGSEWWKV